MGMGELRMEGAGSIVVAVWAVGAVGAVVAVRTISASHAVMMSFSTARVLIGVPAVLRSSSVLSSAPNASSEGLC